MRRDVLGVLAAGPLATSLAGRVAHRHRLPGRSRTWKDEAGQALAPRLVGDPLVVIDGTAVRALALRALDAATSAGANYADVRFTRQLRQRLKADVALHPRGFHFNAPYLRLDGAYERLGVGVRVRVGSGWGFAASPYWDAEDIVRLVTEAATQAKAHARRSRPATEWAPIPVAHGHWATPIQADPFVLSLEEKADLLGTWMDAAWGYQRGVIGAQAQADFTREERALATSEGTYVTQTLYVSEGMI